MNTSLLSRWAAAALSAGALLSLFGLFGCVGAGIAVEEGPVYYGPEYGADPWFYGGGWIGGRRWDHQRPSEPARVYHAPPLHQDRDHPLPHLPDRPRPGGFRPHGQSPGGHAPSPARGPSAPPRGQPDAGPGRR